MIRISHARFAFVTFLFGLFTHTIAEPVRFKEDVINNAQAAVAPYVLLQDGNLRISRAFNFPSEAKLPEITTSQQLHNNPVRSPKILLADPVGDAVAALNNDISLQKSSKSDTEMLTVMERLSERMGLLEQRMISLETILIQMQQDPSRVAPAPSGDLRQHRSCPANFISLPDSPADSPCYFFSSSATNRRHNWQDAAQSCQKLGAKLAEPETSEELIRIQTHLSTLSDYVGSNYWTGGINPGLLWIWSVAAKPLQNLDSAYWLVSADSAGQQDDNGKCLRIAYDRNEQRYGLQGADCQRYLYFVCQQSDSQTKSRNVPLVSTVKPEVVTSNFKAVLGFRLARNSSDEAEGYADSQTS